MGDIREIGKECYGCKVCSLLCPKTAIKMTINEEGFYYPIIDVNQCINCGICLDNCPRTNNIKTDFEKKYYGYINKNNDDLLAAASGGFATWISKRMIELGGYVSGCICEKNNVFHILSNNIDDVKKMRKSKYVQSDLRNVFEEIKNKLDNSYKVLFTGTPCQVHALKLYLKKKYDNLLTIDIICHGCPSSLVLDRYIYYLENKLGGHIENIVLRDKKKNKWGKYYISYECNNRKYFKKFDYEKFGQDFMKGNNLRESCYNCGYSNLNNRPGDFTIGDFWGIEFSAYPINKSGVSSVIVNSPKALEIIENNNSLFFECTKNSIIKYQHNLKQPTIRPKERDFYYSNISNNNFFAVRKNIFLRVYFLNIKKAVRKIIKKLLRLR